MRRTLEQMGSHKVTTLKSWESFEIDIGGFLAQTLIPSAQTRWHDWENSGLIFKSKDWTAVNLNENPVDDALLTEIQARCSQTDVVFVQGFPSTEFPGSFDFTVQEKIRLGRQKRGNVDQTEMVIRHLVPRSVVPIACDIAWHRRQHLYGNYSDKPTPSRFSLILQTLGRLARTRFIELGPGDCLDISSLAVLRPHGAVNYAGFRRRLRKKMSRFDRLVASYDDYAGTAGFDPTTLPGPLEDWRAYFPRTFPVEATVRIQFVIMAEHDGPLARICFCVRGRELSIVSGGDDIECDLLESMGGLVLRRDLFNLCVNRQLKRFRQAVAALRYFITYYFDFGDISPWARISARGRPGDNIARMRLPRDDFAPAFAAIPLRDDYLHKEHVK